MQVVLQSLNSNTVDSANISQSGTISNNATPASTPSLRPQKRHHSILDSPSSAAFFQCFSNSLIEELHEIILKALIVSNISFYFLDNRYFQQYQKALVRPPYKLPTCHSITSSFLPLLHAKHKAMILEEVSKLQGMTLLIYGCTDVSGCSLYAILLQRGQYIKCFIDILNLNLKCHTSDNIYEEVKDSLDFKRIFLNNISAAVTDSPSVMLKFQVGFSAFNSL
ncbi:hypothetical protein O181_005164 [Austropuccinia psidii MF-1]|uniref:Uncharacterized protein n=1 Tax=Austropuccinia psidii MF-1 TaxID=1389203 RepID=A0A9Q3BH07_9BASI|nr:hypothetical protein [Austropuccinia psidii MF-1]